MTLRAEGHSKGERPKSEDGVCRQLRLQGEGNAKHAGTATSTRAGLQAAQRSTPASWSLPAHTCGNGRGGAGDGSVSNWPSLAEGVATSQSLCPAQPILRPRLRAPPWRPLAASPAPPGSLSSPAPALTATQTHFVHPSVTLQRQADPKGGPASQGAREGRQPRAFFAVPQATPLPLFGDSKTSSAA